MRMNIIVRHMRNISRTVNIFYHRIDRNIDNLRNPSGWGSYGWGSFDCLWSEPPVKADFHSVQNVVRSIFSERFLLKCVRSTTANEICSAWLFVIQKKALAKSRSRDILHWMEIRLKRDFSIGLRSPVLDINRLLLPIYIPHQTQNSYFLKLW